MDDLLNFVYRNWGNLASVLGAILTVLYARGANNAATAAKIAAESAKSRIRSIDMVLHFNSMVNDIDSLLQQMGHEADWRYVSNGFVKLKSNAYVAFKDDSVSFDAEIKKRLQQSATQFSGLITMADTYHSEPQGEVDSIKIRKTLSTQRELFAMCLEFAKKNASGVTKA